MVSLQYLLIRRLAPVLLAALMLACTPRYDWRELHAGAALVLLPGKAQTRTRPVDLDGQRLDMTMHAVGVDGVNFAVGWLDIPPGSADIAARRAQTLAAMRTALLRNFAAGDAVPKVVTIPRVERGAPGISGEEIAASGQANKQAMLLHARFVGSGTRVWQFVVYGPTAELDTPAGRQAVETFLLSVRLD